MQNDARVTMTRQGIIRRQTVMSVNCRVLLCYSLILFAVSLIWISITNTQPLSIIIFACMFCGIVTLSCCCYTIRQRSLRYQLERLSGGDAADPNAAEMIAQLRRSLSNSNNGLTMGDFGKIPVILFSEEQYLLDNDPSKLSSFTPNCNSISSNDGLSVDQSGLYCHVSRECSVCLCQYENMDAVVVLPCFHFYHQQCITEWLVRNDACPLCKQRVSIMLSKPGQPDGIRTPPTQMNSPDYTGYANPNPNYSPGGISGDLDSDWDPDSIHADYTGLDAEFGIHRLVSDDICYTARNVDDVESGQSIHCNVSRSDAVDSTSDPGPSVFGVGFGIGRDGRSTYISIFEEKNTEDSGHEYSDGHDLADRTLIRHSHSSPLSRSRNLNEDSSASTNITATSGSYARVQVSDIMYSKEAAIEEL